MCVDAKGGDAAETDRAFSRAAHVVRLETWVHRITGVPMEPRAALASWDPASGRYTHPRRRRRTRKDPGGRGRRARRSRKRGARDGARRRRKFRDAELLLCGVRAGRVGRATPRPPGEVARRPSRGVPLRLSRARSCGAGRAGPRRRRPVPRVPQRQHEQPRRARRPFRAAQQGHGDSDHRLPRSRRLAARTLGGHEHVADHAVSELGPPRGHVRDRAADRSRGAPSRVRPARSAPQESRAAGRDAVPQRRRRRLRQRRLRGGVRSRDGARGLGAGSRAVAPRPAGAVAIAASASRTTSRSTPAFPRERAHVTVRPEGRSISCWARSRPGRDTRRASRSSSSSGSASSMAQVRLITGDTDVTVVGGGAHSARALRLAAIVMAKASDQIVEKGMRDRRVAARGRRRRHRVRRARRFRVKGTDRSVDLFEVAAGRAARRRAGDVPRPARRTLRRNAAPAVLPVRDGGVRSRGRSRNRASSRSCATRPSTTAAAP